MRLNLTNALRGRPVPEGLRGLVSAPDEHLEALLSGTARMGHLASADPVLVLVAWLQHLGDTGFGEFLDQALRSWIARRWGSYEPAGPTRSPRVLAKAWCNAARLVGMSDLLRESARELRQKTVADPTFLAAFAEGGSLDPLDESRRALARRQRDFSLVELWWTLSGLPVDEPWYRGAAGVLGLLQLPNQSFPRKGAGALVSYGRSLVQRVEEGWLDEDRAERFYSSLVRLASRLAPLPRKWRIFWSDQEGTIEGLLRGWLQDAVDGGLAAAVSKTSARALSQRSRKPHWGDRSRRLADRLRDGDADALSGAERLLSEQRKYGEGTGDWECFVQSGGQFASACRHLDPERGLDWIESVRRVCPQNVHSWTISVTLLRDMGRIEEALERVVEAMRLFPENVFVWTSFAQAMLQSGDLAGAERVYRDAISRFPENAYSWSGLANALRAAEKWDEAAAVLADARLRGVTDETTVTLEKAIRARQAHRVESRPPASAPMPGEDVQRPTVRGLLTDSYVLRRWARHQGLLSTATTPAELRSRAGELLSRLAEVQAADSRATAAALLLRAELGFVENLTSLLAEARRRFPGSAQVTYAAVRAQRLVQRRATGSAQAPAEELVQHLKRLGKHDERLRSVMLLGVARAHLEQGELEEARAPLGELGWWSTRVLQASPQRQRLEFAVHWARRVCGSLFGDAVPENADALPDLGEISDRAAGSNDVLDRLEEDAVFRVAVA